MYAWLSPRLYALFYSMCSVFKQSRHDTINEVCDKLIVMQNRQIRPLILVTNDDGVHSPGIIALFKAMKELGDAYIVAPDRERSAVGHALTLHRPLKVEEMREHVYAVNGTPTDAVVLGVNKVLPQKPDLVVSGINRGGNLGDDITYSGTVSAAVEGTILNVPSFAVSVHGEKNFHFETAALFAVIVARFIIDNPMPYDTFLNVNV